MYLGTMLDNDTAWRYLACIRRLKGLARHMVRVAVLNGELRPAKNHRCADCGCKASMYDHRDYRDPLAVEPVCRSCNGLRGPARPVFPSKHIGQWAVSEYLFVDIAWMEENFPRRCAEKGRRGRQGTDPQRIAIIKDRLCGGINESAIAKELGLSRERVRQLINDYNLLDEKQELVRLQYERRGLTVAGAAQQRFFQREGAWEALRFLVHEGYDLKWNPFETRPHLNGIPLAIMTAHSASRMGANGPRYYRVNIKAASFTLLLTPRIGALFAPSDDQRMIYLPESSDGTIPAGSRPVLNRYLLTAWGKDGKIVLDGTFRPHSDRSRSDASVSLPISLYGTLRDVAQQRGVPMRSLAIRAVEKFLEGC